MIQSILLGLAAFLDMAIAYMAIQANSKSAKNKYLALFLFFSVFWCIGTALMLYSRLDVLVSLGIVLYMVAPLFVSYFILLFVFNYPDDKKINKTKFVFATTPLFLYALSILLFPSFFIEIASVNESVNTIIPNKIGYLVYSLYFSFYFFWYTGELILKSRLLRANQRYQIHFFIYTFSITTTFALISNLLVPNIYGIMNFVWIGPLSSFMFSVFASIAIIKHSFLDIRLIFARSLGYLLSIILLGLAYSIIGFTLINTLLFRDNELSLNQQLAFTILAIIIGFSFQPLKRFFDKWTNRLFYKDAYDPQDLLDKLNKILVSTLDLDSLLLKTSQIVCESLKIDYMSIGAPGKDGPESFRIIGNKDKHFKRSEIEFAQDSLAKTGLKVIVADHLDSNNKLRKLMYNNDIAMVIRLLDSSTIDAKEVGSMILGSKKSGSPFTSQDIKVLTIIADELILAIQNALRFEEIQNFNITLEKKVDQATHKLQRANDKLIALDQTKDDFISMASHQLRTPLTSVKGYISMVLEGDAGKINNDQKELLGQAFVSSQRMVYLISDLLNVSRLRTGKFVIETSPINLADIIESEVAQLRETAAARGLKLIYKKPKYFPILMLDETKIRQVLTNYMDNAIYYTPKGGRIEVELKDSHQSIELTVTDSGIGVPRSEQHNLFSKFFRAGNAKKARPDGTGLGLFMAKKVIIAQGGAIIFRSTEGQGSTFGFSFIKSKLKPNTK